MMTSVDDHGLEARAQRVFQSRLTALQARTDRVFKWLFVGQWLFGILSALVISPRTWYGVQSSIHVHLVAATVLGGAVISFPLAMIARHPGARLTRHVIAVAQMIYSALLIHLMGGRIEAHFHVFGSLAILAFYRDATIFIPAIVLVSVDHLVRGLVWPESVFGIMVATPWRALEHAAWVIFEASFLLWGIRQGRSELLDLSRLQTSLTEERDQLEHKIEKRVKELKQQQLLLQEVIDSIPGAVFWKDANLQYLGCNGAFAEAVGLPTPADIVGQYDEDLPWTPEETQSRRDADWKVMSTLTPILNQETPIKESNGAVRTALASRVPFRNASGRVVGVIGIVQDISDRKMLEAQLSQAQKLEAIGQLAAGIAHEINTPMQCVSGNVEFLKNSYDRVFQVLDQYRSDLDGPERPWIHRQQEMHRLIKEFHYDDLRHETPAAIEESAEAVQRVIEIVRAMKAMSHPGTKAKVSTFLNELLRNAAAISKNRWKYVAELELDLEEPLPDVKALPAELSQVFLNLIVNASDAILEKNGDNGELGRITISSRSDGNGVRVDVRDTGCGIPVEIQQRVFEPFFTTKDVGKGTGQGLAIAYDLIVNKHGGRIAIDPGPGVGATFSVWLPCKPQSAVGPEDVDVAEASSPACSSSAEPSEASEALLI
jgi:PAS domain S-box-containing protein